MKKNYINTKTGKELDTSQTIKLICNFFGYGKKAKKKKNYYKIYKEKARAEAIQMQEKITGEALSLNQIIFIQNKFKIIGKKYGLLKEFRENGII